MPQYAAARKSQRDIARAVHLVKFAHDVRSGVITSLNKSYFFAFNIRPSLEYIANKAQQLSYKCSHPQPFSGIYLLARRHALSCFAWRCGAADPV